MLGVCLLFVGIVLINNGMCTLYHVDGRSAAVMSQSAGQQLLGGCYAEFAEILKDLEHRSAEDLCLSAPGFDIRGIQHETLYSRLYMS